MRERGGGREKEREQWMNCVTADLELLLFHKFQRKYECRFIYEHGSQGQVSDKIHSGIKNKERRSV
jgi:hypothetical protein